MWKNNRPEGWENPHKLKKGQLGITDPLSVRVQMEIAYEAGADALLAAQIKSGVRCETLDCDVQYQGIVVVPKHSKGWLVLIPEKTAH